MLQDPVDRAPRHQARQQEVDRQRDPEGEGVEDEPSGEPAHFRSSERKRRAGERARPPFSSWLSGPHGPTLAPGQIRVKDRMLSGKVVKIGSPKKFFFDEKQWKYRVLYVDQRGPMKSGTIGSSSRKIPWSWVAYG